MPLLKIHDKEPKIDPAAWVSPNATLIGDVTVGANSVIWPGTFLRAEYAPITIGQYTTVFDGIMMFTRSDKSPIQIGNYNIIETGTSIFGTFSEDYVIIGEKCIIYERSSIGEGAVIIADSIISAGVIVAERSIMKGDPASKVREQSRNDVLKQKERAEHFTELFVRIRNQLPNLQPYALTETAIMKLFIDKFKNLE